LLLSYQHDGSETLTDSFTFTLSDDTGNKVGPETFVIAVNLVNDPPSIISPATQTVPEDHYLIFSTPYIRLSDPDAGGEPAWVTLEATHGTITLSYTTGLTFITGDGIDDATMVFTGIIPIINLDMEGMVFRPTPNYFGPASIDITVNDMGHSGLGGPLEATATVDITVTSVNDAPVAVNDTVDTP
jgi:hypothetical protein